MNNPGHNDLATRDWVISHNVIDGYSTYGIKVSGYICDLEIRSNTIVGDVVVNAGQAIMLETLSNRKPENTSIIDNTLTSKNHAIDVTSEIKNITIIGNDITVINDNPDAWWPSGAAGLGRVSGTGIFSNNKVKGAGARGCYMGVWIADDGRNTVWTIEDNELNGNGSISNYGTIGILFTLDSAAVVMNRNIVTGWDTGIILDSDDTTANLKCNRITGNNYWGLKVFGNISVDAELNYWGDASGPWPDGSGDGIQVGGPGYVSYDPWLTTDAPANLEGVAPTSAANNDGKITDVNWAMEYRLSPAGEWIPVPAGATELTGLAAGTYEVRYAARGGFAAGETAEVVVPPYRLAEYAVTFGVTGEHGTLTAYVDGVPITTGTEIEEGKTVTFMASPEEGCRVKCWTVNSEVVAEHKADLLEVENISAATNVMVEFEEISALATPVVAVSKESADNREEGVTFTVEAVEGVTFYYTLDGSTPTSSSTEYEEAVTLTAPDENDEATITIKVIAVKEGCYNSDVAVKTVTYAANLLEIEGYYAKIPQPGFPPTTVRGWTGFVDYGTTDEEEALATISNSSCFGKLKGSDTYVQVTITWTFDEPYDGTVAGYKAVTGVVMVVEGEYAGCRAQDEVTGQVCVRAQQRTQKPTLTTGDQTVATDTILIEGSTDANAEITITGGLAEANGTADGSGNFSIEVTLKENQANTLSVTALAPNKTLSAAATVVITHITASPEDIVAAGAMEQMIASLPAVNDLTYAGHREAVEEAEAAYDHLEGNAKALVAPSYVNKLTAAVVKMTALVIEDMDNRFWTAVETLNENCASGEYGIQKIEYAVSGSDRIATFYVDDPNKLIMGFVESGVVELFETMFKDDVEGMNLYGSFKNYYDLPVQDYDLGVLVPGAQMVATLLGIDWAYAPDDYFGGAPAGQLIQLSMNELIDKSVDLDLIIVPGEKEYTGSYTVKFVASAGISSEALEGKNGRIPGEGSIEALDEGVEYGQGTGTEPKEPVDETEDDGTESEENGNEAEDGAEEPADDIEDAEETPTEPEEPDYEEVDPDGIVDEEDEDPKSEETDGEEPDADDGNEEEDELA
jgi:hypothetical protein